MQGRELRSCNSARVLGVMLRVLPWVNAVKMLRSTALTLAGWLAAVVMLVSVIGWWIMSGVLRRLGGIPDVHKLDPPLADLAGAAPAPLPMHLDDVSFRYPEERAWHGIHKGMRDQGGKKCPGKGGRPQYGKEEGLQTEQDAGKRVRMNARNDPAPCRGRMPCTPGHLKRAPIHGTGSQTIEG